MVKPILEMMFKFTHGRRMLEHTTENRMEDRARDEAGY
jgi:hypothetical protein